jgi:hypothetical protein
VNLSECKSRQLREILELTIFVAIHPTLLCAYVVPAWALSANLSLTTAFPWSTGPLSNWMIWLVSVLLFHVLTLKVQAYLNRSARNHINDSMNEEFIPPRFKIARELTQEDEKQLGAAWATASSVVGAGV